MRTERVKLRHAATDGPSVVTLREPDGADEMSVEGVDTACALALLARLLDDARLPPGGLAAADRDALLAALHRRCWGDRIVATLGCAACAARYDLSFLLSDVQRHLAAAQAPCAYRVPSGDDEMHAAAHGPGEGPLRLARACGVPDGGIEAASDALAAAAPIIDLELAAPCAECGYEQGAHFDVQSFVLQRMLNERATLLADVHHLAAAYGWSLGEILSLARSTRRALAGRLGQAVAA